MLHYRFNAVLLLIVSFLFLIRIQCGIRDIFQGSLNLTTEQPRYTFETKVVDWNCTAQPIYFESTDELCDFGFARILKNNSKAWQKKTLSEFYAERSKETATLPLVQDQRWIVGKSVSPTIPLNIYGPWIKEQSFEYNHHGKRVVLGTLIDYHMDKSFFDRERYEGYLVQPTPKMLEDPIKSMEEIINFQSREDDILICTYIKAGTNWIYEITNMLVNGKAQYASKHKHNIGMLELTPMDTIVNAKSPRIINTHVPFCHLPRQHVENGYKIIHMIRNPKDIAVSMFQMKMNTKFWCNLSPTTWSDYLDIILNEKFRKDSWFHYETTFEGAKKTGKCVNIHTVHFEDIKRNPIEEIKRLATFLQHPYTDELITEIADKTSFENLSKASYQKEDSTMITSNSTTGENFLFRKGIVGDWKNWFTVAQNEHFDEIFNEEMNESDLKITFEL